MFMPYQVSFPREYDLVITRLGKGGSGACPGGGVGCFDNFLCLRVVLSSFFVHGEFSCSGGIS